MSSVGPYKGTNLTVEQSKSQIRKLLTKYGISQMRWTEDLDQDQVMFEFFMTGESRRYLVRIIPKPIYEEHRLWDKRSGKSATEKVANWARTYRALFYYIKSKVEATVLGFHTIEEEFMPDIIVKTKTGEEVNLAQAVMRSNLPAIEFKE